MDKQIEYAIDSDGYPTEKTIANLKKYYSKTNVKYTVQNVLELVSIIESIWYLNGFVKCKRKNHLYITLHTIGWSGNEELMCVLEKTWLNLFLKKWEAGGHYYYKIYIGENK